MNPITEKLSLMGISIPIEHQEVLSFLKLEVEESLQNLCNIEEIPEKAKSIISDMVMGKYLSFLKNAGKLEGFDLEAAVKTIQEGDTSVSFALGEGSLTPEQRLDNLIQYLLYGRKGELICFRKIRW